MKSFPTEMEKKNHFIRSRSTCPRIKTFHIHDVVKPRWNFQWSADRTHREYIKRKREPNRQLPSSFTTLSSGLRSSRRAPLHLARILAATRPSITRWYCHPVGYLLQTAISEQIILFRSSSLRNINRLNRTIRFVSIKPSFDVKTVFTRQIGRRDIIRVIPRYI